jgi:hypothetical protein
MKSSTSFERNPHFHAIAGGCSARKLTQVQTKHPPGIRALVKPVRRVCKPETSPTLGHWDHRDEVLKLAPELIEIPRQHKLPTRFAGSWNLSRGLSFSDSLATSSIQAGKTIRPFTQLTYFGAVALFLNVFLVKLIKINDISY